MEIIETITSGGVQRQISDPRVAPLIERLDQAEEQIEETLAQDVAALDSRISKNVVSITRNDKRITNLEQGLPSEDFVTDNSTAYVRDVPSNALPFAEVTEIGGMTYKEGNVLRSASVYEVVSEGVNLFDYNAYLENGKKYRFSVIPNKTLYRNAELGNSKDWYVYDNSGVLLGTFLTYAFTATNPLQLPSNASYIECADIGLTATLYIGYDSNTTYRPYIKRTLSIPETVRPAHGIPNTDRFDRIRWRYDEATDKWARERVRKAIKVVLDGTENWNYATGQYFVLYSSYIGSELHQGRGLGTHFEYNTNMADGTFFIGSAGVAFCKYQYTTVAEWKAYLAELYANGNPEVLILPLATPEITDISHLLPEDNLIGVEGRGSMTPVNEFGYDVPMTVTYQIKEATV